MSTQHDDVQYVRWNPKEDAPSASSNNNSNDFTAFSMLTPRSGAEAMARLAAQAEEEQRLYEQGLLPPRKISEPTNNRPVSQPRSTNNNNNRNSPAPSRTSTNNNNQKQPSKTVSPAASHHSSVPTGNTTPRGGGNNNNKQPHHYYHLNLDKNQKNHPVTPVQVLLQVQESLEHAVQTADKQGDGINEISGPDPQPDYVPVEGSVGIPKFRTFLEQEEHRAREAATNRAMSTVSASSIPRGLLNTTQNPNHQSSNYLHPHNSNGSHLHPGSSRYAASEIIPDDSVSRIHGQRGGGDFDDDVGSDFGAVEPHEGSKTPRGERQYQQNQQQGSPSSYGGHRPLTPRSTVYVTNAVTARFVSERFEASVRDSLVAQEYEHRLDMMRYFYQQHSGIQQRESKSQLREALEQQYLARSEVEELRGAIALRLSDIEEVSRIRLEQIAEDTRMNLEREITRLYGIVSAGQHASQQQWIFGCEERERHFISSESDRVWSRISGNYLSEGHSLQMKTMLKDRIPVAQSRVVNDALDTVRDSPQAVRSIGQLPAQTASAQIHVAPQNNGGDNSNNNNDGDNVQVIQPFPQIRSLRNNNTSTNNNKARGSRTPPAQQTPRGGRKTATSQQQSQQQGDGGFDDDEVKPVNADSLIKPKQQQQQTTAMSQSSNKGGNVEISQVDGPTDDFAASSSTNNNKNQRRTAAFGASSRGSTPKAGPHATRTAARSGSGRVGANIRGGANNNTQSLLDENAPVPPTPRPSGVSQSEVTITETLADRRKKARQEKKQQLEAAKEEKKRQQQEAADSRQREAVERQQQQQHATRSAATRSPQRGGTTTSSSSLIDRPLPNVFHPYWGWMFRSLGALLTWQRRLFVFTSNGRLRCASHEKGPWVLVTTADRIMRVEVDTYHDTAGHGIAPPTTQYHQYGFYIDVIDGDPSDPSTARQKRLRFCCFSRAELTNWMHILRRATETVGQLAELGVPGTTSPLRRRFDDLADEASRLGGPHVAEQLHHNASSYRRSPDRFEDENEKLNEWLSQHQDSDGNPIQAPPVIPYRARVQLEDEVALLEAREVKEYQKHQKELSEHVDPSLKHPHAHYNTMTAMGKPKAPPDVEQFS